MLLKNVHLKYEHSKGSYRISRFFVFENTSATIWALYGSPVALLSGQIQVLSGQLSASFVLD